MRVLMGILSGPNGIFYARKKVPSHLGSAVAQVLNSKKPSISWLKRSLGTRDLREANIIGKPVLIEFDRTLAKAEALLKPIPMRDNLSQAEIDRLADYFYASLLAQDEEIRLDGTGSELLFQAVGKQLKELGVPAVTPFALQSPPAYGLTEREMFKIEETHELELELAKEALARGDISHVEDEEEIDELLSVFQLNLNKKSRAYRQLGIAVLRKKVEALQALERRHQGEPIETPRVAEPSAPEEAVPGSSLRAAFEGWKTTKVRRLSTLREFDLAIRLFEQLHGNIPVASITRTHVRQYREALQAIPVRRSGGLRDAPLPQLVEWSRHHPEQPRLAPRSVNKLLAASMAIASWAYDNGIIPDDTPWANPFAKMLIDVDEAQREPWEIGDLRKLFTSPVFVKGIRPKAGRGDAAYWLPLLGIFTGARLSELGSFAVADVITDEVTKIIYFKISEDDARGRKLKTASSRRAVPLHPELVKLGFLANVVERRRSEKGGNGQLFPELVPGPKGHYGDHWSKWFGRYIRQIGIDNKASVFHSFRHGFKDALRAAGISEDVNDALTGHAGGGVGRSYGAKDIIRRFGLPRLAEAVAKVEYPGLDLSHLMPRSGANSA